MSEYAIARKYIEHQGGDDLVRFLRHERATASLGDEIA